jgi:hypothetical protein
LVPVGTESIPAVYLQEGAFLLRCDETGEYLSKKSIRGTNLKKYRTRLSRTIGFCAFEIEAECFYLAAA